MNILSIDQSKYSTGLYFNKSEKSFLIPNKSGITNGKAGMNIYDSLQMIYTEIVFEVKYLDLVMIEGYGNNPKNRRSVFAMAEMTGIIKLFFEQKGIPVLTVPVQIWKANAIRLTKSKTTDTDYLKAVKNRYGKLFKTTDEADAFMIYDGVKTLCKRTKFLTPAERKLKENITEIYQNRRSFLWQE